MSNTFTGKVSGRMSSRGWAIALGIGAVVLAAILLVVYLDRYRARVSGETPRRRCSSRSSSSRAARPDRSSRRTRCTRRRRSRRRRSRSERSPIRRTSPAAQPPWTSSPASRSRQRTSPRATRRPSTRRSREHSARSRSRSTTCTARCRRCRPATRSTSTPSVGGVVKLFAPNVKVLTIPAVPGPSGGSNLVLRIGTADAAKWAYAADNTQLIFVLRPVVGAKPTKPSTANAATVLR